ncbi:MAG: glycerophosphodiester phosphodiesterase [Burkholderiaceae bacterium]
MHPTDWPYPRFCAHRGAGTLAPENTLAAMRLGADHGYRMFEFDCKLAGDGSIVLMHDDTLDRTTDGHGRVAQATLADLMRLDAGSWHSPDYAGEGVPTLFRVARWLLANDFLANIEIKPCVGRDFETGAAVAMEADHLFRDADIAPVLTSFSESALEGAREAAPDLPRGLLFDTLPDDWLARALALGCVAINPHFSQLSEAVVDAAHDAGLRVLSYTVNAPERLDELVAWGVDTLITDAVDQFAP